METIKPKQNQKSLKLKVKFEPDENFWEQYLNFVAELTDYIEEKGENKEYEKSKNQN